MLDNLLKILCSPIEENRFLGLEIMKSKQMENDVLKEIEKTNYMFNYNVKQIYSVIMHLIEFRDSPNINQKSKIMIMINSLRK